MEIPLPFGEDKDKRGKFVNVLATELHLPHGKDRLVYVKDSTSKVTIKRNGGIDPRPGFPDFTCIYLTPIALAQRELQTVIWGGHPSVVQVGTHTVIEFEKKPHEALAIRAISFYKGENGKYSLEKKHEGEGLTSGEVGELANRYLTRFNSARAETLVKVGLVEAEKIDPVLALQAQQTHAYTLRTFGTATPTAQQWAKLTQAALKASDPKRPTPSK